MPLQSRSRKPRPGETPGTAPGGKIIEVFDAETGLVVGTHADDGTDWRGKFGQAHGAFREDFDARPAAEKEHVRKLAADQRARFDAEK